MTLITRTVDNRGTKSPVGQRSKTSYPPSLTSSCYIKANEFLQQLFPNFVSVFRSSLLEEVALAETNKQHQIKYDGMNHFEKHSDAFDTRFFGAFRVMFDEFLSTKKGSEQLFQFTPEPSLTLISNDDLEESIRIKAIADSANEHHKDSLLRVHQRLSSLMPDKQIARSDIPFVPTNLLECLKTALQLTQLDLNQKYLAYRDFNKVVLNDLDRLYSEINRFLMNSGINIPIDPVHRHPPLKSGGRMGNNPVSS